MLNQIQLALETKCRLDRNRPILAGISGGPDSLCLMETLYEFGYQLIVAHLDHRLRPSSRGEALEIELLAKRRGLGFVAGSEDVRQYAAAHRQSIEESARNVRYLFLFEQAQRYDAQAVATGHTADDQVETVLMHLLRGAGLAGVKGMDYRTLPNPWSSSLPLVRPLLSTWRSEIELYLQQRGLEPVFDESNLDLRYYRNRLRHDLIPKLETLNPGASGRIWQTSEILREDDKALNDLVEKVWSNVADMSTNGAIALDRESLRAQPIAIQRRLIRKAIFELRSGLRDFDFAMIQRALEFIDTPSQTLKTDLADGLRIELADNKVWLADWGADRSNDFWPQMDSDSPLSLPIPGLESISKNCLLEIRMCALTSDLIAKIQNNSDPWQAWLDLDSLQPPLITRIRQPGDRFQPLGMKGHSIKLSDYMINQQIPRRARPRWPLLISAGKITWVPGCTIGETFRVKQDSSRVVQVRLIDERRKDQSVPALS